MPKQNQTALPPQAAAALVQMARELEAVASGESEAVWSSIEDKASFAYRVAFLAGRLPPEGENGRGVTFSRLIAERIRLARTQAAWSQDRLARAMAEAGFDWKRITVAEAEAESRRVSLEELLALCVLFGEPLVSFLIPGPNDFMSMPAGRFYRTVSPETVGELVLGEGGAAGSGGSAWEAAAVIAKADETDWRPAPDLWAARDPSGKTRSER